jgi:hypothetical protein
MKSAGITALREGLPWPWTDRVGGTKHPQWDTRVSFLRELAADGFTIVGGTPILGSLKRVRTSSGGHTTLWDQRTPEWMGEPGTVKFAENYGECCHFYGKELHGIVPVYQILNELDIPIFAGPLNLLQASDLITAAARGLRAGDPDAVLGINSAKSGRSYYLYGRLYTDALLDYCGVDGYLGTWEPGAPEEWADIITELYAITGRPVLVNEWGYSSVGGLMTAAEAARDPWPCELKKWKHGWGVGHNPETQAEFVKAAMEAFRSTGDAFMGCLFYRWEDQERCWQCGKSDCPAETGWGLVHQDGTPKPALDEFSLGSARFLMDGAGT